MDDFEHESYIKAGKATVAAKKLAKQIVKPGTKLIDAAFLLENEIKRQGAELSFPVNISINSLAAHYSPPIDDPKVFPSKGLVKIDIGSHVNGYIADTAFTMNIGNEGGYMEHLVKAADESLMNAIDAIKPGVDVTDLGGIIESAIRKYPGIRPISNLGGHQLKRYDLHAGVFVPNVRNGGSPYKLKEGDVIAIEPFTSTGLGVISSGKEIHIYAVLPNAKSKARTTKDKEIISKFIHKFSKFPFSPRWVDFIEKNAIMDTINNYMKMKMIFGYPIFIETPTAMVAQSEHTVIVTKDGAEITTLE